MVPEHHLFQGEREASWGLQSKGEGSDVAGGSDMSQLRLEECALCTRTPGFLSSVSTAA